MSREVWYNRIIAPVVTEKSTLAQENGQSVFLVAVDATKPQIKAAVEGIYGVKVNAVNTALRKGKRVRFRGVRGQQKQTKRAYVSLAEGSVIDPTEMR